MTELQESIYNEAFIDELEKISGVKSQSLKILLKETAKGMGKGTKLGLKGGTAGGVIRAAAMPKNLKGATSEILRAAGIKHPISSVAPATVLTGAAAGGGTGAALGSGYGFTKGLVKARRHMKAAKKLKSEPAKTVSQKLKAAIKKLREK